MLHPWSEIKTGFDIEEHRKLFVGLFGIYFEEIPTLRLFGGIKEDESLMKNHETLVLSSFILFDLLMVLSSSFP